MLTKFILHGGDTTTDNELNSLFFKELVKSEKSELNVLLCYFAREEEEYGKCYKQDSTKIKGQTKKTINFDVADPSRFLDQLEECDVLYIRGGETGILKKHLMKFPNWFDKVRGKIVAGSSAGVYILSKNYHTNNTKQLGEGFEILDFKSYCHYTAVRGK